MVFLRRLDVAARLPPVSEHLPPCRRAPVRCPCRAFRQSLLVRHVTVPLNARLAEVCIVRQLSEHAEIKQGRAVIDASSPLLKRMAQSVVVQEDPLDTGFMPPARIALDLSGRPRVCTTPFLHGQRGDLSGGLGPCRLTVSSSRRKTPAPDRPHSARHVCRIGPHAGRGR